ncbi:substrate-binding periplasmic protein [Chitinilyticum piscinae]|uniref:Transporter substrate-binding domain-containing protein n=1 Tax=Chitinilyticum piscinae TaxID=2866724 RepID=A0A8J7K1E7_9NEIS|nr:transporter substrate-binding domain-containing protein [Chitinilyticum piscinae]MBE9608587.1 transporter substrate-binding domain-containing protein [Chitinilyticum piscinae]
MNTAHLFRCMAGLLAWLVILPVWAAQSITLTLQEYPPFMGKDLPYQGLLTRVVVAAFAQQHIAVKLESVPNNRAIEAPRRGLYDGSFGWARSPEREKDLFYTESVMALRMVFCQRKGESYPWQTLEELAPYRIGATSGNYYSDDFTNLQKSGVLQVDFAGSDVANLRKLLGKRIDLFPIDAEVGPYLMATNLAPEETTQLSCQDKAYWTAPLHVVISRQRQDGGQLVQQFNTGLAKLKQSGEFARMLDETRRQINQQAQ